MGDLFIKQLVLGALQTNCYLISHQETKETIVIDPAEEAERIQKVIEKDGLTLVAIFLTHGHFDHIGAADLLRKWYHVPIYCYKTEKELLEKPEWNLSEMFGRGISLKVDGVFQEGEKLHYLEKEILVIHTPGHTKGSCCFYFSEEGVLISGDTLFAGSVGRTDFPTGSSQELKKSVLRIAELPEETKIYPGHYEETTVFDEKQCNPFLVE